MVFGFGLQSAVLNGDYSDYSRTPSHSGAEDYYEGRDEASYLSEDYEHDLLADTPFDLKYNPEYRLKIRKSVPKCMLGLNYGFFGDAPHRPHWVISAKPLVAQRKSMLLRKVELDTECRTATIHSGKVPIGKWLRLQGFVGVRMDLGRPQPFYSYAVTTKWNQGGSFARKEKLPIKGPLEGRMQWLAEVQFPELSGGMGIGSPAQVTPTAAFTTPTADFTSGSVSIKVSRVDVCLLLDRLGRKKKEAKKGEEALDSGATELVQDT